MPIGYSIVIPAYNEARSIERAVRETVAFFSSRKTTFEVIVVDDGSRDKTAAIVRKLAASIPELYLVVHPKNRGKGAAVRTGVMKTHGNIILFLDADLSTPPSEFRKFIPLFKKYDLLLGSRRVKGAKIATPQPWYRTIAGRVFNFTVRMYLGIPYHDTQCGFKAFRSSVKPIVAEMQNTGWVFDVELILRAKRAGLKIAEVPIVWRHGSESRVHMSDAWKILQEVREIKREV